MDYVLNVKLVKDAASSVDSRDRSDPGSIQPGSNQTTDRTGAEDHNRSVAHSRNTCVPFMATSVSKATLETLLGHRSAPLFTHVFLRQLKPTGFIEMSRCIQTLECPQIST